MAKHEITIYENTGATSESAPYLGKYVSKSRVELPAFAKEIAAKCGVPAIQAQAIIAGSFDAIAEQEAISLSRFTFDGFTVCGVITGSFPTSDAAFDATRNALNLAIRLDDDVRYALSDVTPKIVTDEESTKVRVDNIADEEYEKPYNLIHGKHVFRITGINLVTTDTGAEVFLLGAAGTTFPITIDEVVSKQVLRAHTTNLLESGDYKLVVKSRGGDAEGPLQTSYRKVKYLKVIDPAPTVTSMKDSGGNVVTAWPLSGYTDFCGTNLPVKGEAGISLKLTYMQGTQSHTETITAQMVDVGETGGAYFRLPDGLATAISEEIGTDRTCTFTMTNGEGHTGTFVTQLAAA